MLSSLFGIINIFLFTNYNSTKIIYITKKQLLYPFFFATYMVLFDTCDYCVGVSLSVLVRRTTGPNMSKL